MHFLPTALNFLISRCSSNFVSLFLKILKFGSSYVLPFRYQRLSLTKKSSSAVNLFKANFRSSALSCFFLKLSMILIMFFLMQRYYWFPLSWYSIEKKGLCLKYVQKDQNIGHLLNIPKDHAVI